MESSNETINKIENITSKPFKAVDGTYHETMAEVDAINRNYFKYDNPMIIDKDSELFEATLSQEILDKIMANPNYRSLIDILEEKINSIKITENESKGIKK